MLKGRPGTELGTDEIAKNLGKTELGTMGRSFSPMPLPPCRAEVRRRRVVRTHSLASPFSPFPPVHNLQRSAAIRGYPKLSEVIRTKTNIFLITHSSHLRT